MNAAAVVATSMVLKFPRLRFGLLVGIGGGVATSTPDIRPGDVVVSQPSDQYGGVWEICVAAIVVTGACRGEGSGTFWLSLSL